MKIDLKEFEIWTDSKYSTMIKKCEYYGSKPFWQTIKKLDIHPKNARYRWEPGEVVPYFQAEHAQHFAFITELLNYKGVLSFKGFDVASKAPVLVPIPKFA